MCVVFYEDNPISFFLLQPDAPATSLLHGTARRDEEEDGDLNKALGVHRFQQILSPASTVPDEQLHNYHEEDIECKYPLVFTSGPFWRAL